VKPHIWMVAVVMSLGLSGMARADSLYTEDAAGLLSDRLGDRRSGLGPGGLVTVIVNENLVASSGANTKTAKTSRTQAGWNFGTLLPRFNTGAIDVNGKIEFQGDGVTRRADNVNLLITATIQEVLPDGTLRIEGSKDLRVNDEESTVRLSGVVRPFDINIQNQVTSTQVANLKLDFKGAGTASAKATPGILSRLLNFLF